MQTSYRDHILNLCVEYRNEVRCFIRRHKEDFDTQPVRAEFERLLDDWDRVMYGLGIPPYQSKREVNTEDDFASLPDS